MNEKLINLVKCAINGDKKALIELIKNEQNNIYTTLYYLKKNNDEISDIMQNVLIKISGKISQLKNPEYFKTCLNKIIVNAYLDYLRKYKRKEDLILTDNLGKYDIADSKANPQNDILLTELDYIIKNSIQELPAQYKIPLTLREVQGLSYNEISDIAKISIGTVKSRIARARNLVQNKLKKYTKDL